MTYSLHLLMLLFVYTMAACSLNMVIGYCGLLNLAHAGYFALGAYTYALCTLALGWGYIPATLSAAVLAAALSLCLSVPARRFKGDFFVLISLAVQLVFFGLFYNWYSSDHPPGTLENLTNGPFGLEGVGRPEFLGKELDRGPSLIIFAGVFAAIVLAGSYWILTSPWGRLLKAIRDDEIAVRSLGKSPGKARTEVMAIACAVAAVAGSLYASYLGYVDPSLSSLDQSMLFLAMVLLGGVERFWGPMVGAAVLLLLPELLREVGFSGQIAPSLRNIIVGVVLCILMHSRPEGLLGSYKLKD